MQEKRKINLSQWSRGRAAGRALQRSHKARKIWPKEGRDIPVGRHTPVVNRSPAYLEGFAEGYKTEPIARVKKGEAIAS